MSTYLLDKGLLPAEASTALASFSYLGPESVNTFPNQITDWMLLELYSESDTSLVAQKASPPPSRRNGKLI